MESFSRGHLKFVPRGQEMHSRQLSNASGRHWHSAGRVTFFSRAPSDGTCSLREHTRTLSEIISDSDVIRSAVPWAVIAEDTWAGAISTELHGERLYFSRLPLASAFVCVCSFRRPLLTLTSGCLRVGANDAVKMVFSQRRSTFAKITIIGWYLERRLFFTEPSAVRCRLCWMLWWMQAIRNRHSDAWFISTVTAALPCEGALPIGRCLSQSPNYLHPAERGQREPLCVGPINYMV